MVIPFSRTRRSLVRAGIVLTLLLVPAVVRANVGPPSSGGHVVAEPVGIEGVAITRETLTIDLRPLAANGLAQVEAVYHLQNHGPEKKLDLLFASGSASVADFQVWLGRQPVTGVLAKDTKLPASWQAPTRTPGLRDERDFLDYRPLGVTPIAFTITLPPGLHDMKVRYAAEATIHRYGHPTVYRQFAYVLAPARAWSSFGGLDVTVHLPVNWRVSCTPALTHGRDTLKGSFAELPADAIALTVQAPEGWAYRPLTYVGVGLFGLTVLGGAVVCRNVGRRLDSLGRHLWAKSIGLGTAWGLAVLGTGLFAIVGPDWVLPSGQANHYGFGQALAFVAVLCLSILAVPVGIVIARLTAVIVCRNEMPSLDRTPMVMAGHVEPAAAPERDRKTGSEDSIQSGGPGR